MGLLPWLCAALAACSKKLSRSGLRTFTKFDVRHGSKPWTLAAIKMATAKTFGDINTFAIRYQPYEPEQPYEGMYKLAICHLIINGKVLGSPEENCYLPTWFYYLSRQRDFIETNGNDLFTKEFQERTDREIFEMILKANQLETEFSPDFLYLPQLNEKIWSRHSFTLDETIDVYLFYFYVMDDRIHFLIEDRSAGDVNERTENFIFSAVPVLSFISTVDEALLYLQAEYPYLANHRNKKEFNSR
jgi:hypothetical protein